MQNNYLRIKKRYTLPIWIIRMHLIVALIALFSFFMPLAADTIEVPPTVVIWIFVAFLSISLILDILSLTLYACDALHPLRFLLLETLQTTLWALNLIIDGAFIVNKSSGTAFDFAIGGLGVSGLLLLSAVVLLSYAGVKWRRERGERKRGSYVRAGGEEKVQAGEVGVRGVPHPYEGAGPGMTMAKGKGKERVGMVHREYHGPRGHAYKDSVEQVPARNPVDDGSRVV